MKRFTIGRLLAPAALLVLLAGCVSTTTSETRVGGDASKADARRQAEVHTMLAGEYYSRGGFAIALDETRIATKFDPNYLHAWNMQGLIYMELRDDVQAREAFERALKIDPNNAEILNNFGWFLCVSNQHVRGLEMLNKALIDPLYPTPEKAFMSAGICMRRAGRLTDAEDYLRRAIAIRPDLIGALYNLAEITFERGNAKEADAFLTRYMRIGSPNPEALALGLKVARANNDKLAEESYLQQLTRRFPDSPQAREAQKPR